MKLKNKTIFITGTAGFIGFHLAQLLLNQGYKVIGLDGITDYYDINLKKRRHEILSCNKSFIKNEGMLEDKSLIFNICEQHKPDFIVHLAAQAGVRYSIENPEIYLNSNILGTFNILEASRKIQVKHLLMASTSSVYGSNFKMPFTENMKSDTQMSFYAATKKANENMSHSYSHIYNIPTTMFRFFTVYGPWGRPDMALFKFADAITKEKKIDVYNYGKMKRDFTYIDDLVKAISLLIDVKPKKDSYIKNKFKNDSISNIAPWRLVNICNSKSINLLDFIHELEKVMGKQAKKNFLKIQAGDVVETLGDNTLLKQLTGYTPSTEIKEGIKKFFNWYKDYYSF